MRTKTLDDDTSASDPGHFDVDPARLAALEPELVNPPWYERLIPSKVKARRYQLTHISEHLRFGDSRAALVISVEPLIIAAYTDELDCVALLGFPVGYRPPEPLKVGARLITVNTYAPLDRGVATDLTPGEGNLGNWGNFAPYIADLLCDQPWRIDQRVRQISEDEWRRCEALAAAAPRRLRDGRPTQCWRAAW